LETLNKTLYARFWCLKTSAPELTRVSKVKKRQLSKNGVGGINSFSRLGEPYKQCTLHTQSMHYYFLNTFASFSCMCFENNNAPTLRLGH
jgi:hypothetical protein